MNALRLVVAVLVVSLALPLSAGAQAPATTPATSTVPAKKQPAAPAEKCEHGVQKTLCTRCNPKLAAVFKAKGDWCAEHARPESQCSLCHEDLARQGVKP